jgi:hypothetical protein
MQLPDRDPRELVDEVLMEKHLEEHYGVEPEGSYDRLVEYIRYLQEKAKEKSSGNSYLS